MAFTIAIGGDIVPSFKNTDYFCSGDIKSIISESCYDFLNTADYRIYNLETPITDNLSPINKDGANFAIPSAAINGLKKLKPDYICIANNHCKDQGEEGLVSTIDTLTKEGITPFGYGLSHENANDIVYVEKDNIKVAIIACAEVEFTIFDKGTIGAVPYHDYWTNRKIGEAKKNSDVVVVLYHGGNEYFPYVTPYLKERCHLMANNGADYIICQHSHCIGCYENYHGSTIVYGQGNFIFHQRNNKPITKKGLLIEINISKEAHSIRYIPVILNDSDQVCFPDEEISKSVLTDFEKRSLHIGEEEYWENTFGSFLDENKPNYMSKFLGGNILLKTISKVMRKLKVRQYSKSDLLKLLNLMQNEAHRELCIEALKREIDAESRLKK